MPPLFTVLIPSASVIDYARIHHIALNGASLYQTQDGKIAMHDITPGVYRHYKGPLYDVIGVARHSETEELLVVYRPQYGERGLWVRPLSMFTEQVTVEGQTVPRFAWIS
mgnify:CR=1 FL=1